VGELYPEQASSPVTSRADLGCSGVTDVMGFGLLMTGLILQNGII